MKNLIYGFNDPEHAIKCVYEEYEITKSGDVLITARCDGGWIIAPWEMFQTPTQYYNISAADSAEFERFFDGILKLNKEYGDHAIYHLSELLFPCDLENKFRDILCLWTNLEIK